MIKTNSIPEINCDLFIIPNQASPAKNFILKRYDKEMQEISDLNNLDYNENTKLVQVWSTYGKCDNMQDHNFHIIIDDINYSCRLSSVLPETMFSGAKENDVITCTIPVIISSYHKVEEDFLKNSVFFEEIEYMLVKINFTLKQREYRYRHFGNFEDVYKMVCA